MLAPLAASRPPLLTRKSAALGLFVLLLFWSLAQAGVFGADLVNGGGWTLVGQFIGASMRPDLSPDILALAIPSMLVTLAYAVCGTALCIVIGLVGCVLSSEVWWRSVFPGSGRGITSRSGRLLPWLAVRGGLAVPRAIHEVIWGLFFINILGLDPLVAILAIGIPFGAITAKVYGDILDETPRDPLNALLSSGASPLKAFLYTLLPQAFPDLLSYGFYRLECAIRSTAVLGLLGAGGLGYQVLLSLQSLRYDQVWTFLYLLVLLSGLTDGWSSLLHRRLHVSRHGEYRTTRGRRVPAFDPFGRYSLVVLLAMVPLSFWYIGADVATLFAPRASRLFEGVVRDSFPPNLDSALLATLFNLSGQTIAMSVLAMVIAGVGGFLFSIPAANLSPPGGSNGGVSLHQRFWRASTLLLSRGVLLLSRALSEGIWALLALFVLFPGTLPGAVALGLYNLGVLGRLMAEVSENADQRPLRALEAQGATKSQTLFYALLPQTLTRNLAYILYRWEVCVRATVVVGLVGAGGLGRLLGDQLSSFDYRSVLTSLLFYLGLTFLVDLVSAAARRLIR